MDKIYYLNRKQTNINPVLVITTSHRLDCLILCLRCLEKYTNVDNFKQIYIISNEASEEHQAVIGRFTTLHPNAVKIETRPRGLVPAVANAFNAVLAAHQGEMVLKLDDDVFVTPHWLEHLLAAAVAYKHAPQAAAFAPVVPVSSMGREALLRFLRGAYPSERSMYLGSEVAQNWVYHRWMWEKVLRENLVEAYLAGKQGRYLETTRVDFGCLLMGPAMTALITPLPMPGAPDGKLFNPTLVREKMENAGLAAIVAARTFAHHYSYAECEDYLRSRIELDEIWKYMHSLPARERFRSEVLRTADSRAAQRLALVRA